ncbi:MAG: ABC transporter permease [Cellvibrionaceae bacterium]
MKGFSAILRNELVIYFTSPIGYILIGIFWAASGYFFSFNVYFVNAAHMVTSFHNMSLLLMLILPLITMRVFSEEVKMGTMELLLTLPISEVGILAGKLVAILLILLAMLGGTAVAVLPLMLYGNPDIGPIIGGYIGVFLIALGFIGIGFFVSSLSSNQVVAAVVSWAVILLLWFIDFGASISSDYTLVAIFQHLSLSIHYIDLIRGVIDYSSVAYLLGLFFLLMVGTIQALKLKRLQ